MKKLASLSTLALAAVLSLTATVQTHAQTFLFDFGNTSTTNPASDGNYWNNVTESFAQVPGNQLFGLRTTDDTFTDLNLEIVNRFNAANTNGTQTPLVDYPVSATRDSLYGNTSVFGGLTDVYPSFKITGLDLGKTYDFTFFASRTGVTDNRETLYTITGGASGSVALNAANNVSETVTLFGMTPNSSGEILIGLTPGPNNTNGTTKFTYINVLEMTAVPEPSTAACLLGGMAVLVARRRRTA